MIGLERFSLYQNEDELKADLEQTNLVNCLSWNFLIQRDRKGEDGKLTDKFMNEMLFYAVKEEDTIIDLFFIAMRLHVHC